MNRKHPEEGTTRFESGSGNVFADLALPDPEEAFAKARLGQVIAETIEHRGLTQEEAAKIMGLDQREVAAAVRGRFAGLTHNRLTRCVLVLGDAAS